MIHRILSSYVILYILTDVCSINHARQPNNLHFWDLEKGITKGQTLKDLTVRQLQTGLYNVEASGSVENYSKWPLKLIAHETAGGYEMRPLPYVIKEGTVEGYASRKISDTATGVWMRYSLVLDDDIYIHFMYSVPYNFNFNVNWLAVATCSRTSYTCRYLTAGRMYYNNYPFMDKKSFYKNLDNVKKCYDDICVSGWMERTHRPVVRIKILPRSFYDLAHKVRDNLTKLTAKDYDDYIKSLA